jgi:hypothetical protein
VDSELNKKLIITPLNINERIGIFFPSREMYNTMKVVAIANAKEKNSIPNINVMPKTELNAVYKTAPKLAPEDIPII